MQEQAQERTPIADRFRHMARACISLGYYAAENPLLGAAPGLGLAGYTLDGPLSNPAEIGVTLSCGYASYRLIKEVYDRYDLAKVARQHRAQHNAGQEAPNKQNESE